jgi:hypothetical protein
MMKNKTSKPSQRKQDQQEDNTNKGAVKKRSQGGKQ